MIFMEDYLDFSITSDLKKDIQKYFYKYHRQDTFEHTLDVINELSYIKEQSGHVEQGSEVACLCHDLGRVVRNYEIIDFCIQNHISISDEEKLLPSILHQRISCSIAKNVFKIEDTNILDAIKYHSTSRKNPSRIEIEVCLADKMSWKEDGYKELAKKIKEAMNISKEYAMFYYLRDLYNNRQNLSLYHSDSKEAFEYFREKISIVNTRW